MGQNHGTGMVLVGGRSRRDRILAGTQRFLGTRVTAEVGEPHRTQRALAGDRDTATPVPFTVHVPTPLKNLLFQEIQLNPSGCHKPTGIWVRVSEINPLKQREQQIQQKMDSFQLRRLEGCVKRVSIPCWAPGSRSLSSKSCSFQSRGDQSDPAALAVCGENDDSRWRAMLCSRRIFFPEQTLGTRSQDSWSRAAGGGTGPW